MLVWEKLTKGRVEFASDLVCSTITYWFGDQASDQAGDQVSDQASGTAICTVGCTASEQPSEQAGEQVQHFWNHNSVRKNTTLQTH